MRCSSWVGSSSLPGPARQCSSIPLILLITASGGLTRKKKPHISVLVVLANCYAYSVLRSTDRREPSSFQYCSDAPPQISSTHDFRVSFVTFVKCAPVQVWQNFHTKFLSVCSCECLCSVWSGVHRRGMAERVEWTVEARLQWATNTLQHQQHHRVGWTLAVQYSVTHFHSPMGKP